jgi:hypothetical protein
MNLAETKLLFRPTYDPFFCSHLSSLPVTTLLLLQLCYHWDSAYYDTPSILFWKVTCNDMFSVVFISVCGFLCA